MLVNIDGFTSVTLLQLEQLFFFVLCVCIGLFSGFLGGLLGIGGGIVIVPILTVYFDATARFAGEHTLVVAVATSLACIVFTSASAAYTQYRAGKVRWDIVRRVVAFVLIGSFTAGAIAPHFSPTVFRVFIGVFFTFVAVVMLSSWQPHPHRQMPGLSGSAGLGFGAGLVAGLAGIAGGNVLVPSFVYFNVPVHNATASSSALGVPIALTGALGYIFFAPAQAPLSLLGYIDLEAFLPIVLGALISAPIGVKLAHRVPAAQLKRVFGGLLLVVAIRMFYSALTLQEAAGG